jgi:hypothetical protein
VSAASCRLRCGLLLFHDVDDLIGDAEIFDLLDRSRSASCPRSRDDRIRLVGGVLTNIVTAHVAFWQSEELVAFGACLHDFFEGEVHVGVALDQVAVESLAVFELDEHGVALGGGEKTER